MELGSMDDPRLGLPSASGMDIYVRCEGAYNLIKELNLAKVENDAMRSGTLIHKALETKNYEGLNKSQSITADLIAQSELKIISEYGLESCDFEREVRYWYEAPFFGKLYSGQPDIVFFKEDGHVLSINYKTGWGELPPIEESMQILTELVLVYVNNKHKRNITKLTGILLAPNSPNYKRQDITFSIEEIEQIGKDFESKIESSIGNVTDPIYTKGNQQCKYCPAKAACPAHKDSFPQTLTLINSYYTEMLSEKAIEKIDCMSPLDRSVFYENIGVMQDILKSCESKIKELTDKKEVHGYRIKEVNGKFKITNHEQARDIALGLGLTKALQVNFESLSKSETELLILKLNESCILERSKSKRMEKIKEPKKRS